jgi:hypothetical protein
MKLSRRWKSSKKYKHSSCSPLIKTLSNSSKYYMMNLQVPLVIIQASLHLFLNWCNRISMSVWWGIKISIYRRSSTICFNCSNP